MREVCVSGHELQGRSWPSLVIDVFSCVKHNSANPQEPTFEINKVRPMQHDLNLIEKRPTFVTNLECSMTGKVYEADRLHNL